MGVLTVFAGDSLSAPLMATLEMYESETGAQLQFIAGDSDSLARDIENGEHCDIFIPDKPGAIDALAKLELASEENVRFLFLERLAVVIRREPGAPPALEGQNAVEFVRHARRIGILISGGSRSGYYAKESLDSFGIDTSGDSLVVLPALSSVSLYLEKAEIDCAVLFASEIYGLETVTIVDYLPPESHTPYAYPLVVLPGASAEAGKLRDFLLSPDARKGYSQYGYDRPDDFDKDLVEKNTASEPDETA